MMFSPCVARISRVLLLRRGMPAVGTTKFASRRLQSSCTTSLVSGSSTTEQSCQSTVHHVEKKDFSTAPATIEDEHDVHWDALLAAAAELPSHQQSSHVAQARKLDLIEAAAASTQEYDKILLLVRHGEAEAKENLDDDESMNNDPLLTGRGVGQVLNLSRRTATFCNDDTGLVPELVVTSPLKRAIQTALMIFPQYSPFASLKQIDWVCQGHLMERPSHVYDVPSPRSELERSFPGLDYSLYNEEENEATHVEYPPGSMLESKMDLVQRTDEFLEWLRGREERVIVVSSHSTWLQSFCGQTLNCEECGSDMFAPGEMRAIGIKFD